MKHFLERNLIITSSSGFVVQGSSSASANEKKESNKKGSPDSLFVYKIQIGHFHYISALVLVKVNLSSRLAVMVKGLMAVSAVFWCDSRGGFW